MNFHGTKSLQRRENSPDGSRVPEVKTTLKAWSRMVLIGAAALRFKYSIVDSAMVFEMLRIRVPSWGEAARTRIKSLMRYQREREEMFYCCAWIKPFNFFAKSERLKKSESLAKSTL